MTAEKTYEVTENEKEAFVVEKTTATTNKTYQKAWLEEEKLRIQALLDEFSK